MKLKSNCRVIFEEKDLQLLASILNDCDNEDPRVKIWLETLQEYIPDYRAHKPVKQTYSWSWAGYEDQINKFDKMYNKLFGSNTRLATTGMFTNMCKVLNLCSYPCYLVGFSNHEVVVKTESKYLPVVKACLERNAPLGVHILLINEGSLC